MPLPGPIERPRSEKGGMFACARCRPMRPASRETTLRVGTCVECAVKIATEMADDFAVEESIWSFDVDDVMSVPEAVTKALAEADRQGKVVLNGPQIERLETPDGDRWSLTFTVEGPVES